MQNKPRAGRTDLSFFLLSLAVFGYQNILGPVFSALLTGLWQAWVMVPSFLGISCGLLLSYYRGRILAAKSPRHEPQAEPGTFSTAALVLSFAAVGIFLQWTYGNLDRQILEAAGSREASIVESLIGPIVSSQRLGIVLVLTLPFVFFGYILGMRLRKGPADVARTLIYEFAALAAGGTLAVAGLSLFSPQAVLAGVLALAVAGDLLAQPPGIQRRWRLPALLLLPLLPLQLDLQRDPHIVTRDFQKQRPVKILDTRWKSFAKVQLLDVQAKGIHYPVVSVGDGVGLAWVSVYTPDFRYSLRHGTAAAMAVNRPRKALILFGGAASEAVDLHRMLGDKTESWVVELNPAIREILTPWPPAGFTRFFSDYRSHYRVTDNRYFLETTPETFDSILFSWSGATVANYSGAILHTTQYSFTGEALEQTLRKLNPGGLLVIMGGNKLNILMSLRTAELKGLLQTPGAAVGPLLPERVVLLSRNGDAGWKDIWDNYMLVYKNGPWTPAEVRELTARAGTGVEDREKAEYKAVLTPWNTLGAFRVHRRIMTASSPHDEARALWAEYGIQPLAADDDYPFVYRNTPRLNEMPVVDIIKSVTNRVAHDAPLCGMALLLAAGAALAGLMLRRESVPAGPLLGFLGWAPSGAALTGFFMYKGILFLGNPEQAFLLVLLSTQAGILAVLAFRGGWLVRGLRWAGPGALPLLAGVILIFSQEETGRAVFQLGFAGSCALLAGTITLLSAWLSAYFLKYVPADSGNRVLALWTAETFLSGLCSLAFVSLVEEAGVRAGGLVLTGFAILLVLAGWRQARPHSRRAAGPSQPLP